MSVIELSLGGRGPKRGFVFDEHRFALPCWAKVGPALLISFDRHFDTVPPVNPPPRGLTQEALERHTEEKLDRRNYDHILAAQACGVITDAILIARAKPVGARTDFVSSPTLDVISAEWGTPRASPEGRRARELVLAAERIVLDVDLDCFTTPSDADPTTVIPWPTKLIFDFIHPRGAESFWAEVLAKCVGLTFAREPNHCGGLIASGRLFEAACEALFVGVLHTDLP